MISFVYTNDTSIKVIHKYTKLGFSGYCALYSSHKDQPPREKPPTTKYKNLVSKQSFNPLHTSVVSIWTLISISEQSYAVFPSCNLCSGHRWDLVQSLQRFTAKTQTRQGWDCALWAMHDQRRIYGWHWKFFTFLNQSTQEWNDTSTIDSHKPRLYKSLCGILNCVRWHICAHQALCYMWK